MQQQPLRRFEPAMIPLMACMCCPSMLCSLGKPRPRCLAGCRPATGWWSWPPTLLKLPSPFQVCLPVTDATAPSWGLCTLVPCGQSQLAENPSPVHDGKVGDAAGCGALQVSYGPDVLPIQIFRVDQMMTSPHLWSGKPSGSLRS